MRGDVFWWTNMKQEPGLLLSSFKVVAASTVSQVAARLLCSGRTSRRININISTKNMVQRRVEVGRFWFCWNRNTATPCATCISTPTLNHTCERVGLSASIFICFRQSLHRRKWYPRDRILFRNSSPVVIFNRQKLDPTQHYFGVFLTAIADSRTG